MILENAAKVEFHKEIKVRICMHAFMVSQKKKKSSIPQDTGLAFGHIAPQQFSISTWNVQASSTTISPTAETDMTLVFFVLRLLSTSSFPAIITLILF